MKSVGELTQAEIERLHPREQAAIVCLLADVQEGRQHPASSDFDLTPSQLASERHARALARLTKGA